VAKTPISDEELQLRKRARRRLVGAIVLVLLVVVLVPMFLEREPRQQKQDVDIRIPPVPGQSQAPPIAAPPQLPAAPAPEASSTPQAANPSPAQPPPAVPNTSAQLPPIEVPAITPPAATESAQKQPPSQTASRPAPVEQRRAEAAARAAGTAADGGEAQPAAAAGDEFVIQLGAFSNAANAKQLLQQLKKQKFPAYTEVIKNPKGDRTRVRVGPYPSVEVAQKARERLKALKLVSAASDANVVRMGE
jgi:DedD protein